MTIRQFALAAIPVLGIACSHASKQAKSQDHTGAMWSERETEAQKAMEAETRTAAATPSDALAMTQGTGSQGESMGGSSPNTGGSSGSQEQGSASGSAGSSDSGSSMQGGSESQGGSMGQSDTGAGSMGKSSGKSAGMTGSKKHAGMHHVSGKISQVSSESVTITPTKGEAKTLKIGPDTKVSMNGKSAQATDLKEGQQVRATFDSSGGEDTATRIWTGKGGGSHARKGKSSGGTGSMGGSSGGGSSK